MSQLEHAHQWEYRWGKIYRRCTTKGCDASEWYMIVGNYYRQGRPCNIDTFHTLSARALTESKAGTPQMEFLLKTYKKSLEQALKNPTDKTVVAYWRRMITAQEAMIKEVASGMRKMGGSNLVAENYMVKSIDEHQKDISAAFFGLQKHEASNV